MSHTAYLNTGLCRKNLSNENVQRLVERGRGGIVGARSPVFLDEI